jgi:hypothetical protein
MVDETILSRHRANESQRGRFDIFLIGRVVSVLWDPGGPGGEVSGARRGLRHEGGYRKVREKRNKREGESCWKSGGGRVRLYNPCAGRCTVGRVTKKPQTQN